LLGVIRSVRRGSALPATLLCGVILCGPLAAQDRTFVAEGSDTVIGLGARHLAMGGTGTATADDPHAIYYNPARLALIDRPVLTFGRQLDAELRAFSFAGFALPLTFAENFGWHVTLAAGRYPRVHARSSGAFGEDDPESIFLRILLPGISGTYDGDIDSKTLVYKFAAGFRPMAHDRLSFGINVDWIDCRTNSCGVHAGSDGVEEATVHARALSFGAGLDYRLTDRLTLAATVTDIDTTLRVDGVATDESGTTEKTFEAKVPMRLNLEAAWQASDTLLLAAGYQLYSGEYGKEPLDVRTAHLGAEWHFAESWASRFGMVVPFEFRNGAGDEIEMPFPFAPTLGLGWKGGGLSADLALFAHPIMTFHEGAPVISAELSVSYSF